MKKHKLASAAALSLALTLAAGAVSSESMTLRVQAKEAYTPTAAPAAQEASEQEVSLARQTLGLTSVDNARQLGGYETKDGRHIRSGLLLRTAKLSTASADDLKKLTDVYHLGTVVDFRTSQEIAQAPDPVIPGVSNVQIRILNEDPNSSSNASMAGIYSSGNSDNPAASLLVIVKSGYVSDRMYVDFALDETAQKGYHDFFEILLNNPEGKSVLWHCTGGKDRAGTAAVLLLSALGVDRETILNDFALTNEFVAANISYMGTRAMELTSDPKEINDVMYLTGVNRNYMELMLDTIDQQYGSIENYLVTAIGLSPEEILQLQAMYLE